MRSTRSAHPLYRLSLYLYPRKFREHYGNEMVQTLQDLLDEHQTVSGRAAVWLRVAAETPFSVMKEIISSRGENNMDKVASVSNKRLLIGGAVMAAAIIVTVLGFARIKIIRSGAHAIYGSSLRSLALEQNTALANPFSKLSDSVPEPSSSCMVGPSSGIHLHMECEARMQTYTKLG